MKVDFIETADVQKMKELIIAINDCEVCYSVLWDVKTMSEKGRRLKYILIGWWAKGKV